MLQYDLNATPVGFEPTHGDRNRFQVCLLNRSDKASYFHTYIGTAPYICMEIFL